MSLLDGLPLVVGVLRKVGTGLKRMVGIKPADPPPVAPQPHEQEQVAMLIAWSHNPYVVGAAVGAVLLLAAMYVRAVRDRNDCWESRK